MITEKIIDQFLDECGVTPGPWCTGKTLLTRITRRWPKEQWDRNEEKENRAVFANFNLRDNGGGRYLISSCTNKTDARIIAASRQSLKDWILTACNLHSEQRINWAYAVYKMACRNIESSLSMTWADVRERLEEIEGE